MFAPTSPLPAALSRRRTHMSDTIVNRNSRSPQFLSGGAFERAAMVQFLASRGISARFMGADDGEEGEGEAGGQGCATQ